MFNLDKLESLKSSGLVDSAFANIKKWLADEEYAEFHHEIQALIEAENVTELNEAFYKIIPFGTGGRRGQMGAGTNRINSRTIAESAQGVADYLMECFNPTEARSRGVVITYDVRHNSEKFAKVAAEVFVANDFKVYFYNSVRSTPQISFTIRDKNAIAGAMISASHNPPSDNGIKVYLDTGGQVVPPHDTKIIEKVNKVSRIEFYDFDQAVADGKIVILGEEVDEAYQKTVEKLSLGNYRDVYIVFTPLHGCASISFLPVLRHAGFSRLDVVELQMPFDPDFSAVTNHIPNPEVPISLNVATKQARESGADLVVASDPDADRIGIVSREKLSNNNYIFLNGNQIGVLLFDYITKQRKIAGTLLSHGVLIKTIVTTDLLTKIAEANNLDVITDLPVGFKYIANAIDTRLNGRKFVFGTEESHGYLYGDYCRDKDGAIAALLICEYAAFLKQQGRTLFEQLEFIKKEYGYFREILQAIYFPGMDGMDKMLKIMSELRLDLPTEIGGMKVAEVFDQSRPYGGFP
ncbi:MAG: phospho-sugar mutase, partial [Candidatus Magasanikbacteria bacterium]|nr:phospho-sugar mutase [Candidatus Magasanikbacteria bacterium]